jgi:hypothetical protein
MPEPYPASTPAEVKPIRASPSGREPISQMGFGRSRQFDRHAATTSRRYPKKPDAATKRFISALKKHGRVDVLPQGRFESATGRSFGHQNRCEFRFEIVQVVRINVKS